MISTVLFTLAAIVTFGFGAAMLVDPYNELCVVGRVIGLCNVATSIYALLGLWS